MIGWVRRMFVRRPSTPTPPVEVESTLPAIIATQQRHAAATPKHRRVLRRVDAALELFDAYKAESDFLDGHRK